MKRFVLKLEGEYVQFIHWVANIIPRLELSRLDEYEVYKEAYFDLPIEKNGLTRKELILKYYPDVEFIEVNVTLQN